MKISNCPICNELITENAPTFKVSLGFGDYSEFDALVIHRDCVELEDPIRLLVNIFETDLDD